MSIDQLLSERTKAGHAAAEAATLDLQAAAEQSKAETAYKGDDKTYAAVEKADAHRRRTSLNLRLAQERLREATKVHAEAEHARDTAEAEQLRAETSEAGFHNSIAPIVTRTLALDAKLCALHIDFAKAVEEQNGRLRRLNELALKLNPSATKIPLQSLTDVSWLTSSLVSSTRRTSKAPTPSIDVSRREQVGDLPEHFVTTRAPAGFSETNSREAEFAAQRFIANTKTEKEKAA